MRVYFAPHIHFLKRRMYTQTHVHIYTHIPIHTQVRGAKKPPQAGQHHLHRTTDVHRTSTSSSTDDTHTHTHSKDPHTRDSSAIAPSGPNHHGSDDASTHDAHQGPMYIYWVWHGENLLDPHAAGFWVVGMCCVCVCVCVWILWEWV